MNKRMMLLGISYSQMRELSLLMLEREPFIGAGTIDIHLFAVLVLRLSAAEKLPRDAVPISAWDCPAWRGMELCIHSEQFEEAPEGQMLPRLFHGSQSVYKNTDPDRVEGRIISLPDWAWAAVEADRDQKKGQA